MSPRHALNADIRASVDKTASQLASTVAQLAALGEPPPGNNGHLSVLAQALREDQRQREITWARTKIAELFDDAAGAFLDAVATSFSPESAHRYLDRAFETYRISTPPAAPAGETRKGEDETPSNGEREANNAPTTEMLLAFLQDRPQQFRRIHPHHPKNFIFTHENGTNIIVNKHGTENARRRALNRIGELLGKPLQVVDGTIRPRQVRLR